MCSFPLGADVKRQAVHSYRMCARQLWFTSCRFQLVNCYIFQLSFSQIASLASPQCLSFLSATASSLSSPLCLHHVISCPFIFLCSELPQLVAISACVCPGRDLCTCGRRCVCVSHAGGCWHTKVFLATKQKPTARFLSLPQTTGHDLCIYILWQPRLFISATRTHWPADNHSLN